jgi:hypothetical protein
LHGQSEPKHLVLARQYIGVTEVTNNSSPDIDMFLKYVKLPPGNPYCAAYASYCIGISGASEPKVRSGLARNFITKKSIPASKVLMGAVTIPVGSIVVWRRGNTLFGHVGFTSSEWLKEKGKVVEANTSSGQRGSQYDGEGIYERTRYIQPAAAFRITDFTLVTYE